MIDELQKIANIWSELDCFLEVTSYSKDYNYYLLQGKKYAVNANSIKVLLKFGYIAIDMSYTVENTVKYVKRKDFVYSEYKASRVAGYFKESPRHGLINRRFSARRRADNVPR